MCSLLFQVLILFFIICMLLILDRVYLDGNLECIGEEGH